MEKTKNTEKSLKKFFERFIDIGIITFIIIIGSIYLIRFLGIHSYIVRSGSMEPIISTGSLCLVDTDFDYKEVAVGDVIAFELGNTLITHRVMEITNEGFITKGDNNDLDDGLTTTELNYIGKTIVSFPGLGYIISYFQSKKGKIVAVTIVLVLGFIYKLLEDNC